MKPLQVPVSMLPIPTPTELPDILRSKSYKKSNDVSVSKSLPGLVLNYNRSIESYGSPAELQRIHKNIRSSMHQKSVRLVGTGRNNSISKDSIQPESPSIIYKTYGAETQRNPGSKAGNSIDRGSDRTGKTL